MHVSYDLSKREKALADRGLDFEDAVVVFDGLTVEVEDTRKDYGEKRIICYGLLGRKHGGCRLHPAWHGAPNF